MIRRFKVPLILLAVEILLYWLIKPADPEFFFLVVIIISGFVLLYNIFSVSGYSSGMTGIGAGREAARMTLTTMAVEKTFGTKKSKTRSGGGLFDPSNLSLLVFVLVNMALYRWVM